MAIGQLRENGPKPTSHGTCKTMFTVTRGGLVVAVCHTRDDAEALASIIGVGGDSGVQEAPVVTFQRSRYS